MTDHFFKQYDSLTNQMFQVMDNEGEIINPTFFPSIDDETLFQAFRLMLKARTADLQILSYQRQGRIFTYPPSYGQEAIATAMGMIIRDQDWLVPAFREMAAYLAKGATLKEIFLYYMGHEKASRFLNAPHMTPFSVPIASQLLHAVGIAYEIAYRQKDQIVFGVVGDGGTSEGDFHEALNFAGVWKVPVVFIIQNNQYGISTPVGIQTASKSLAIKSVAYGINGIQVDGNDVLAMMYALQASMESIRHDNVPVLIEAVTYRRGAHTTSDDPTKYRTKEEEDIWAERDPVRRFSLFLQKKKLLKEGEMEEMVKEFKREVHFEFEAAEKEKPYELDEVFDTMYKDTPLDLEEQKQEHIEFLKWKEGKSWQ